MHRRLALRVALVASAGCSASVPAPAVSPPAATAPAPTPAVCARAAGPAPLRRLSRSEYVYAVEDLLTQGGGVADLRGTSVVAGATLPADETVGPFRSNIVAGPTPLDVQQLMESAERVAARAADRSKDLLACAPPQTPSACADAFVARFGRRAFRRPLHPDEQNRYADLFAHAASMGGAREGVRAVVRALLQSPYFVMHTRDGGSDAHGVVPLGPYALASRLSFFLWSSGPDEALLDAAARGELATADGLRAHARRMLADDRARRGLNGFFLQWLGVEDVASVEKKRELYPAWNPTVGGSEMGAAFRKETERFIDHVFRAGDGRFATLMTSHASMLEGPLFAHYGVDKPAGADAGNGPVWTALPAAERAGLLTQGSVLAAHGHAAQTSPVDRGVLIRKSFLCQELPSPPPNVNNTPPEPDSKLTTRQRFDEHRESGVCSRCHALIDPIGFAFERYDTFGRHRDQENGQPIDARGTFVDAEDLNGDFDGAVELANKLANSPSARACHVRQWLRFALGRRETGEDACSLAHLQDEFERSGGDVRALLTALPTTDSFRFRSAEPPR